MRELAHYNVSSAISFLVVAAISSSGCNTQSSDVRNDQMANGQQFFAAFVNARADGGSYNPVELAAQESSLEKTGLTKKSARKLIVSLLMAGISPDRLQDFEQSAVGYSKLYGTSAPQAARQISEAFSGGYDAVASFDNRANFLTSDQRVQVRDMFEAGKFSDGRSFAFGIFKGKIAKGVAL